MNQRFPKAEHLCSRRLIERLHAEGQRIKAFPYSVQWISEPRLEVPCQVLIVVPKRRLHHAVDRNRIKRLTRECYRLHKEPLLTLLKEKGEKITLSFVYVHNELMTFAQLSHRIDKALETLQKELTHEETVSGAEMAAE